MRATRSGTATLAVSLGILLVACVTNGAGSPADGDERGASGASDLPSDAASSAGSPNAVWMDGAVEPGTHRFLLENGLVMTVTLPEGWSAIDGWLLLGHGGTDERDGIGIAFWDAPDVIHADPCHWEGSAQTFEPSIEGIAAALAAQDLRSATEPRPIMVGEHEGLEVEMSVPDDIDFATCDADAGEAYFQSWTLDDGGVRYHQGPGQRDLVRVLDIDGTILLVNPATWPELPAEREAELDAILESMSFEQPTG
jgi:hypothetical protein